MTLGRCPWSIFCTRGTPPCVYQLGSGTGVSGVEAEFMRGMAEKVRARESPVDVAHHKRLCVCVFYERGTPVPFSAFGVWGFFCFRITLKPRCA